MQNHQVSLKKLMDLKKAAVELASSVDGRDLALAKSAFIGVGRTCETYCKIYYVGGENIRHIWPWEVITEMIDENTGDWINDKDSNF